MIEQAAVAPGARPRTTPRPALPARCGAAGGGWRLAPGAVAGFLRVLPPVAGWSDGGRSAVRGVCPPILWIQNHAGLPARVAQRAASRGWPTLRKPSAAVPKWVAAPSPSPSASARWPRTSSIAASQPGSRMTTPASVSAVLGVASRAVEVAGAGRRDRGGDGEGDPAARAGLQRAAHRRLGLVEHGQRGDRVGGGGDLRAVDAVEEVEADVGLAGDGKRLVE